MPDPNTLNRRTFLEQIGLVAVLASLSNCAALRFQKLSPLEQLERFALQTQEGLDLGTYSYGSSSSELELYEWHFQQSLGNQFTYKGFLEDIKKKFPKDQYLLVCDIGGNAGTAAAELDKIDGIEAFVIDPLPCIPAPGVSLPRERFIIRPIEETGLPDESFHFMTSFNTYQYTDLPKSFTEVYRLLKPGGAGRVARSSEASGGVALIEHEFWYEKDWSGHNILEELDALSIKDYVWVASMNGDKKYWEPLGEFIAWVRSYYNNPKNTNPERTLYHVWPSFHIIKPNE